jgi:hypothetical protein
MNRNYFTFLFGAAVLLTNSSIVAQTVIKFTDQSCKENCDAIKNLSNVTSSQNTYLNFSIDGIKKIELKPTEVLMVELKFYDESSSFEKLSILAKQNDNGVIVGESLILPSSSNSSLNVNTIYNNEFNFRIIERLKSQNGGNLKLHIEKYSIMVYDKLKKQNVTMDYGVLQEDLERFKQFINVGTSYEIKKYPAIKINCESKYPFDEMSKMIENEIKKKKETLYLELANNTSAPQEYKLNNFNGIESEITKDEATKILNNYFNESQYNVLNISKRSNEVFIEKEMNGIPKYKWFYINVYLQGPKGNCGYAPVTLKSHYLNNGNYADWKVDVYQYTACTCE